MQSFPATLIPWLLANILRLFCTRQQTESVIYPWEWKSIWFCHCWRKTSVSRFSPPRIPQGALPLRDLHPIMLAEDFSFQILSLSSFSPGGMAALGGFLRVLLTGVSPGSVLSVGPRGSPFMFLSLGNSCSICLISLVLPPFLVAVGTSKRSSGRPFRTTQTVAGCHSTWPAPGFSDYHVQLSSFVTPLWGLKFHSCCLPT